MHTGAVYVHQGEVYVVDDYDVEAGVAEVHLEDPEYSTQARSTTEIGIVETERTQVWGEATIAFGTVDVVGQVMSYVKRTKTGSPSRRGCRSTCPSAPCAPRRCGGRSADRP